MKILFVENRYCTRIWQEVGYRLSRQGHEVAHMIQNPVFAPKNAQCFVLPFPPRRKPDGDQDYLAELPEKLQADRTVRYWNGSTDHYPHYMREILKVLDEFRPNVIFGEPTQFHEILTIEAARHKGIPFLFPSSTRYPAGRMVFFKNDTMQMVGGDGQEMSHEAAAALRQQIANRESVPSYMMSAPDSAWKKWVTYLADKVRVTMGWLLGERYVTPLPWTKIALEKKQTKSVQQWEKIAQKTIPDELGSKPWVLYAMQMQPESNLDVWGYPWNNQTELIMRAATALEKIGIALVVKPNPKSKYELTSELIDLVTSCSNVIALSHETKMGEVFPRAQAVLSVTGTIILECVMSGKPVAVLGDHELAKLPGVTRISCPEEITQVLEDVQIGAAKSAAEHEAIKVLQTLYQGSYPGVLYDPLSQSDRANISNLDTIATSFMKILKVLR